LTPAACLPPAVTGPAQVLVANAHKEISKQQASLSVHAKCSVVVEVLLKRSTQAQLLAFAESLKGYTQFVAASYYGSHVMQTLLSLLKCTEASLPVLTTFCGACACARACACVQRWEVPWGGRGHPCVRGACQCLWARGGCAAVGPHDTRLASSCCVRVGASVRFPRPWPWGTPDVLLPLHHGRGAGGVPRATAHPPPPHLWCRRLCCAEALGALTRSFAHRARFVAWHRGAARRVGEHELRWRRHPPAADPGHHPVRL
jgi:hypothetical protein